MNITSIDFINIFSWVTFGLIIGLLTHLIDPASVRGGVVGTLLTGLIGSLVGGFFGSLLFGTGITGFNLQSFFVAVLGSLIFASVERLIFTESSDYGPYRQYGLKGGRSRRKKETDF
jgi:uncharacterized membrane protein YeaQ/YmgE (transglycosylase-associated protein family)